MPTYEYRCSECNQKFSIVMSISEHGKQKQACPKCKSKNIRRAPEDKCSAKRGGFGRGSGICRRIKI